MIGFEFTGSGAETNLFGGDPFVFCFLLCFVKSNATIWSVGSSQTYPNPSDIVSLVSFGDTIEIDAGTYTGDFCIWNTDQLYIKGVGGFAHFDATGFTIPNSKAIWVINGDNFVIENGNRSAK